MSDNTVTRSLIDALNSRVADLEHEMAELKRQIEAGPVKDWRRTVGMFTGDDVMKAIFEEGQKIREADREKARKQGMRRKSAKPQRTKA